MKLHARICLITNCGQYMGPAVAAEFLREGAQLVLHMTDRTDQALPAQHSYFPPEDLAANPERHERLKQMLPLGRLAEGESARLAVYLASENADFLCGEVIKFSSGWN